jgi:NADH:ubiquinone oxidoreductase subunit B-like Fe-S oxidoreductase
VQVFDVLKCTMQRAAQEDERKTESAWLRDVTPSCCNVELVLTKLMANRYSVDVLVNVLDNIVRDLDSLWPTS